MPKRNEVDEAALLEIMQLTPDSRECDTRLLELSYEQIRLYMELHSIPGDVETYIQSIRGYWQYIDSNPKLSELDETPR